MNLEKLRKKSGYSQQEFAALVGVTQSAVSQWENGLVLPTTKKLVEIASVLRCTTDDLLKPTSAD